MRLNLILGFTWMVIGVPLLVINATGNPMFGIAPSRDTLVIGALASVLAVYNFARWYASRALTRRRNRTDAPPEKRRVRGATMEYNPEFDFSRPGPRTLETKDEPPAKAE